MKDGNEKLIQLAIQGCKEQGIPVTAENVYAFIRDQVKLMEADGEAELLVDTGDLLRIGVRKPS